MRISIQTKFLTTCVLLVLLTTLGISITYYVIAKQNTHRESRQRIQIAFDIILDDFAKRMNTSTERFNEFLGENHSLLWAIYSYRLDSEDYGDEWATIRFLFNYFSEISTDLKTFGRVALADRVMLYGVNKQLLVLYQQLEEEEIVGSYLASKDEGDLYLPMDDLDIQTEITLRGNNADLKYKSKRLPETPPPPGVSMNYEGEIPDSISITLFNVGQKLGIRFAAPIFRRDEKIGILVSELLYTQDMVEGYAALSQTAVNFFVGNQLSIGTFQPQTQLEPEGLEELPACEEIMTKAVTVDISPIAFNEQGYYQGQCGLRGAQGTIGAVTVNLSQEIEKREMRKILTAVFIVAGIALIIAFGLSILFSRNTIQAIQNIVSVIVAAAEGDLRKTASARTRDEIGMLADKLNQMITQLRTISGQVQGAASTVNITADAILQQMDTLIQHMEEQSASVENTTDSFGKINQFIADVAQSTETLFAAAEQALSSIQQSRASIAEVTTSIGMLSMNLQRILASMDQVSQSVKHVSVSTGELADIAQHTETEIHHIDHSFHEVLSNAEHAQQLARETMDAVTSGQSSVNASIQGMNDLKAVVANTAGIIQEVSSWSEQVSSILDIVDEITEQTSLLALNASIISAQAGGHGRGFAVVADEIKNLATRTKTSTKEISTLTYELQMKTKEGVAQTIEGIAKAEQGVQLAHAVKVALATILDSATRSSNRAEDTVLVIQQRAASSQAIKTSMAHVTEKVASIRRAIQDQEHDIEQAVDAVENISGMSEQVNRASLEQKAAAEQIAESMEQVIGQFGTIAEQTETLKQDAHQIVTAMHTIEDATEKTLHTTIEITTETVRNLLQESDVLQKIVNVFKVK